MRGRFRRCVSTIGSFTYACYAWALFCIVIVLIGGIVMITQRPGYGRRLVRFAARSLLSGAGIRYSIEGIEHLPSGPHILLVNHTSFIDPIVLSALLPPSPGYAFVARQQFAAQSALWPLLRGVGTLIVAAPALHHRRSNVQSLTDALHNGQNLLIFPEGRIRTEPGVMPLHSGAFRAAAAAGVPIVVAGFRGTREVLPLGHWRPRRREVMLKIGPAHSLLSLQPVSRSPKGFPSPADALRKLARKQIAELADEPEIALRGPISDA